MSTSSNWHDRIHTTIHIAAPAATVFSILTDTPAYPAWNPFILSITPGPLSPHSVATTVTTVIKSGGGGGTMTFKPTVQRYVEGESVVWLGRLGWGGLFDGQHGFHVTPDGPAGTGCVFVHEERFSGLVVWLGRVTGAGWYSNLMRGTKEGFESMNRALKQRAEAEGAASVTDK